MESKIKNEIIESSPIRGFKDFNLKEQLFRYVKYWYWFIISFLVAIAIAFLYLRYTIPQYSVSSTIVISQEDNLSAAGLGAFEELGLERSQTQIESEIEILKSKTLIRDVVEKLKLNIQYFSQGNFIEIEYFNNAPIKIDFLVCGEG